MGCFTIQSREYLIGDSSRYFGNVLMSVPERGYRELVVHGERSLVEIEALPARVSDDQIGNRRSGIIDGESDGSSLRRRNRWFSRRDRNRPCRRLASLMYRVRDESLDGYCALKGVNKSISS
jgi:hypothetical protein